MCMKRAHWFTAKLQSPRVKHVRYILPPRTAVLVVADHFWVTLMEWRAVFVREMHIRLARRGHWRALMHLKAFQDVVAVFFLREAHGPCLAVLLHLASKEP